MAIQTGKDPGKSPPRPPKPRGTPPKPPPTERRVPQEANVAVPMEETPLGQLQTIRDLFKITGDNLDRVHNLACNIHTCLIGHAPEEPRQELALPDGELYIIPIQIQDINARLGELEAVLHRVYETL